MSGRKGKGRGSKHSHYDSKHRGPGNWDALHSIAHYCDIQGKYSTFIMSLKAIVYQFRCLSCREHGIKYINNNPPDVVYYKYSIKNKVYPFDSQNMRTKYPCSYYINMFHNFVSGRLGKTLYDLSESLKEVIGGCDSCVMNIQKA